MAAAGGTTQNRAADSTAGRRADATAGRGATVATSRGPVQERGRRRRDALVEAAAELLVAGGTGAVTHRSVAERAVLPLASTTYYFASRDDLLDQALARLVERDLERMRSAVAGAIEPGRPVEEHARAIVDALIAPPPPPEAPTQQSTTPPPEAPALQSTTPPALQSTAPTTARPDATHEQADSTCWDLYIQIGHEPSLQPRARAWTDGIRAIVTDLLRDGGYRHTPADVRLMIAVVDGLSVENLVEDRRGEYAETVGIVARVLTALRP